MAALTESTLRQLANSSTYPESAEYDNDGDGGDHDSLGLFQMRPQSGWGSVKELMDPEYQARAFFGGPDGPNAGSPRGLLDIPGWEEMSKGEAVQSVEVSAFPDRYDNYAPVAEDILDALSTDAGKGASGSAVPVAAESSRVVFPLPEGTWTPTSPFGPRTHPITGEQTLHTGSDFSAPDSTPIPAAAAGTLTRAEYTDPGRRAGRHRTSPRRGHGRDRVGPHVGRRHPRDGRRYRHRRPAHRRRRLLRHVHRAASAFRGA